MGNKRKKGSSSSANEEEAMATDVKGSIDSLKKVMEDGFASLREEVTKLREDFKNETEAMKDQLKALEQSITFTQTDVDTLKEKTENNSKEIKTGLDDLNKKIEVLENRLKAETENNIKLEQYTRRENLRFNNITEIEKEDCKTLIRSIIQNEMDIDNSDIKFHAVHRVGVKQEGRFRPIIARFISRQHRDLIWQNRGKIKNSDNYPDAYITEDFARAIQLERKTLIKAMMKARESAGLPDAKVVGRFLIINNERYDHNHIPEYLK